VGAGTCVITGAEGAGAVTTGAGDGEGVTTGAVGFEIVDVDGTGAVSAGGVKEPEAAVLVCALSTKTPIAEMPANEKTNFFMVAIIVKEKRTFNFFGRPLSAM
jgi:hypothetical protein